MNISSIPASAISFQELFTQYSFQIPLTQRPYSWATDQWLAFQEEVMHAARTGADWVVGPLLFRADPQDQQQLELIDGSQRLVTFLLMTKALRHIKGAGSEALHLAVFRSCQWGADHDVLEQWILEEPVAVQSSTRSQMLILAALNHFRKWIDSGEVPVEKIQHVLDHQLRLDLHILPPASRTTFSNHQPMMGRPPTELDQILAFFSGLISPGLEADLLNRITTVGKSIRLSLGQAGLTGPEDEDKLFRVAFQVAYQAGEVRVRTAIPNLRKRYRIGFGDPGLSKDDRTEILDFLGMMEDFARHLVWIYQPSVVREETWPSWPTELLLPFRQCLDRLGRMPDIAATCALVLPLLTWMTKQVSYDERITRGMELLRLIETAHFRLTVLPRDQTRSRRPQWYFSNLGFTLWHHEKDEALYTEDSDYPFEGDILDWILQDLIKLVQRKGSDEQVIDALTLKPEEDFSFFWWPHGGLAWFLAEYEQHLRNGDGPPFIITERQASREDLDLKTPGKVVLGELWRWEDQAEVFGYSHHEKDRLGNFFLRDLTMDDRHPAVGLPDYIRVLQDANAVLRPEDQLLQVAELSEILQGARQRLQAQGIQPDQYPDLPRVVCNLREERLICFALERWAISAGEMMRNIEIGMP